MKENLKDRYKVELKLNLENLSALDREDLCKKTDCIFETEGLRCEVFEQGMRIYTRYFSSSILRRKDNECKKLFNRK